MSMDEQQAIQQFLGDRPDTSQLREWRTTLEDRVKALRSERSRVTGDKASILETRIAQLEKQVAALREEEAITEFVEDSVRVTLAMGTISAGMEELE